MKQIIEHMISVYNFKLTPCSIPSSSWQNLKKDFYGWMFGRKKLGIFNIRDLRIDEYGTRRIARFIMKLFPVKYLNERLDGTIWFEKRGDDGKLDYELSFKPVPPEVASKIGIISYMHDPYNTGYYSVKLYLERSFINDKVGSKFSITGFNNSTMINFIINLDSNFPAKI